MNLLFDSINFTVKSHKDRLNIIKTLSIEKAYQQTLRTSLGLGWIFFRDIVYFTVYILFRYLIAGSSDIDGMNFILYVLLGMIPWNFMREVINGGVTCIKGSKPILSSMAFPVAILPTIETIAIFIRRLFTLVILFIVIIIFDDIQNVTWWMFIYYFMSMFILMVIWNFIFSALVAISNDFEQLYKALASVLFYTLPVMWSFKNLSNNPYLTLFLKLNPFVYIIEGFRDTCFVGRLPSHEYTIYFWVLCFILFALGSILQFKLKRHYIDII